MQNELFKTRWVAPNAEILSQTYNYFRGLDVLLEQKRWDFINGMTATFLSEQVNLLPNETLYTVIERITGMGLGKSEVRRDEKYTYVKFRFQEN